MQPSCGLDPSLRPLAHPEAFSGTNEFVGFLRNFGRAGELASMALRDRSGHGQTIDCRGYYARPVAIACSSVASASGAVMCGEWLASISW
jgi:hypothetical protein